MRTEPADLDRADLVAAVDAVELDREALDLHRRMWVLADIAGFVAVLRRPHADTVDMRHALGALEISLGG